jgi:flagellar biosynthesis protein FliQ
MGIKILLTSMIVYFCLAILVTMTKGRAIEDKPLFFVPVTLLTILAIAGVIGGGLVAIWG